jgi:hypothetical protein
MKNLLDLSLSLSLKYFIPQIVSTQMIKNLNLKRYISMSVSEN